MKRLNPFDAHNKSRRTLMRDKWMPFLFSVSLFLAIGIPGLGWAESPPQKKEAQLLQTFSNEEDSCRLPYTVNVYGAAHGYATDIGSACVIAQSLALGAITGFYVEATARCLLCQGTPTFDTDFGDCSCARIGYIFWDCYADHSVEHVCK